MSTNIAELSVEERLIRSASLNKFLMKIIENTATCLAAKMDHDELGQRMARALDVVAVAVGAYDLMEEPCHT